MKVQFQMKTTKQLLETLASMLGYQPTAVLQLKHFVAFKMEKSRDGKNIFHETKKRAGEGWKTLQNSSVMEVKIKL